MGSSLKVNQYYIKGFRDALELSLFLLHFSEPECVIAKLEELIANLKLGKVNEVIEMLMILKD